MSTLMTIEGHWLPYLQPLSDATAAHYQRSLNLTTPAQLKVARLSS